jgi:hypothetical protein
MSSTNRSNARDSHVSDYYVTPTKPIIDLFNALKNSECCDIFTSDDHKLHWWHKYLDPCAGGDENNEMSYPKVIESLGVHKEFIETIDIRENSKSKIKGDFLQYKTSCKYRVVITNPPFNIAEKIIKKSFEFVEDGGYVIMLLRLNFFGAKKRKIFWENNMPILTFVHRERISFTKKRGTDSIEYMHCVWKKGVNQNFTKLQII